MSFVALCRDGSASKRKSPSFRSHRQHAVCNLAYVIRRPQDSSDSERSDSEDEESGDCDDEDSHGMSWLSSSYSVLPITLAGGRGGGMLPCLCRRLLLGGRLIGKDWF